MKEFKLFNLCFLLYVVFLCHHVSGQDSVRFLVLGDWGGLPIYPYVTPIETSVAKRMAILAEKQNVQFVLALGDNFYFDGVKDVHDKRFKETYGQVFWQKSLYIPWYFLAGNHDHNGNVTAQIAYSKTESRWNFPDLYYDQIFKIPNSNNTIQVVMIDTVVLCGNSDHDFLKLQPKGPANIDDAERQWTWLEHTLQTSRADYLIVAGHYPVFSVAEHGPTPELVSRLKPMLYKYKVTAYFSGHDHNLQHLLVTENNYTVSYFVSGAACFIDPSRQHDSNVPKDSLKFFWSHLLQLGGCGYVEATMRNMTWKFYSATGEELYTYAMYPRSIGV